MRLQNYESATPSTKREGIVIAGRKGFTNRDIVTITPATTFNELFDRLAKFRQHLGLPKKEDCELEKRPIYGNLFITCDKPSEMTAVTDLNWEACRELLLLPNENYTFQLHVWLPPKGWNWHEALHEMQVKEKKKSKCVVQ